MRFAILLSGYLGFVTTSLSNGAQFSETRDLPPLKLAAGELDAILSKTHSFLDVVNGPTGESSARESVKLGVRGHEIEIPHFSLASSLAFPNKIFGFSYIYSQDHKAVSSLTIDLSDSSRCVSVTGESADKVGALSNLLDNEFRSYSTVDRWSEIPSRGRRLPFDVVLDVANGQQCVLLEGSKLRCIGDADLFCAGFPAPASRAVEEIASPVLSFINTIRLSF